MRSGLNGASTVKQLKEELKLEIAHSQASRPLANKTAFNLKADGSTAKILKLYEDMTNVQITGYKAEPAEHGLTDNDVFSCIVSVDERSKFVCYLLYYLTYSQV
jgi:hypothetical protein